MEATLMLYDLNCAPILLYPMIVKCVMDSVRVEHT